MDANALFGRPASLVGSDAAWVRCTHDGTTVGGESLTLAWTLPEVPDSPPGGCAAPTLATDRLCRVYRPVPGALERLTVGGTAGGLDYAWLPRPTIFLGGQQAPPVGSGEFTPVDAPPALDPAGVAVDGADRLFVADRRTATVTVLDLWSRRVLRTVPIAGPAHPARRAVGVVASRDRVLVALAQPPGILALTATSGPGAVEFDAASLPPGSEPAGIAVLPDGVPVLLATDDSGRGWLVGGGRAPFPVGGASAIVVDAGGLVVVAPCAPAPGERALLRRYAPTPDGWAADSHALDATGYDGGGIVVTRDGRIGYFTDAGFRLAAATPVSYATTGTCTTFRLDSGVPRNRWGRVLIEASVPVGTAVAIATATSDDDGTTPAEFVPSEQVATERAGPVHRRPGPVTPWWRSDERVDSFDAPVLAPPGRYVWVKVRLTGSGRRTPCVHELRVEQSSHSLMRRLPAVFSADRAQAEFLHRYLSMFDGMIHDLDLRARCRDILVDPAGTPAEALDWLASFLGLVLDDRWAESARRRLVAEISELYRRRGTVWALRRYLQLFLAGDRAGELTADVAHVVIVEHFRLRGVGGVVLGDDPTLPSSAVVGAGFRVGGVVGELGSRPLDPEATAASVFATHAHRFTVLIGRPLDDVEEGAIRHILSTERPAHTVYDLCTVEAGMRVGHGIHLGLSSLIGPTAAFERTVVGRTALGRRSILGPPTSGIAASGSRVGSSTTVG